MKRKLMKNLMLIVAVVMLCFAVGVTASAEERTIVASGECGDEGDNVIWTLYDDGELVISGEGKMRDYHTYTSPFYNKNIKKATIENGVTTIGQCAFDLCDNLESISISDSVSVIGSYAFQSCDNLTNITIPNGVTSIGKVAFNHCTNLTNETIPNSVTTIGKDAFCSCGITDIVIPDSVISIGNGAFSNCRNLRNVIIGNGITTISERAFDSCSNLINVDIGDNVTTIGDFAFSGCGFTNFTIPDGVTTIGYFSFYECYNITTITIPASVNTIGDSPFIFCRRLKSIKVDENNKNYSNDDFGVLFNKDKSTLIQYPFGNINTTYIIPDSVTNIGLGAFMGDVNFLTTMTIPENVTFIDCYAFVNMQFLDKMVIRSMDATLNEYSLCSNEYSVSGISREAFMNLYAEYLSTNDESIWNQLMQYVDWGEPYFIGTIYCHAGSTAEAYAIENGVDYVLAHFFEGEWTYDYDNMIRYRKCIHCDELETEPLETTTDSDVEIIEPADPDTDFVVDVITDYVVIEETISNNVAGDFEIVKAFDITMKNKDGIHVQPDGTVKVKLPLDWSKDGVYKVYRVNDDGTLTDMNAYREGSHMVFETDHFSVYVIVDESEKADEPTTPDKPQEETKKDFFSKIIDWFRSLIDLITSWFKK